MGTESVEALPVPQPECLDPTPAAPLLPDTPPDAMGHHWGSYGMSSPEPPASEAASGSGGGSVAEAAVPTADGAGTRAVAEALTRLTTVDLEAGAKPGSMQQELTQQQPPAMTLVWMKISGETETKKAVSVSMTPEQCKLAGLELVSGIDKSPDESKTHSTTAEAATRAGLKQPQAPVETAPAPSDKNQPESPEAPIETAPTESPAPEAASATPPMGPPTQVAPPKDHMFLFCRSFVAGEVVTW